jgi:recombination protein RecT
MPQELTNREMKPIDQFRGQMDKMADQFEKVLPPHMTPDKLYRTVITSVQNTPKLLQADRNTLLAAIMTSAALGLEPDGVTGQGYLVPFKGRVQFIPGYKGYITLAMNSGFVLEGHVVYENDHFTYQAGTDPNIMHAPSRSGLGEERGGVIAAYAVARSNSVPTISRVIERPDLIAVRDGSSGYKAMGGSSPWVTNFDAMCRKTAIRQLGGNLPLNVQRLAAIEAAADRGGSGVINNDGEVEIVEPVDDDDGIS